MNVRAIRLLALLTGTAVAGVIAACSGGNGGDPVGGYDLRVSGQLVDWRSGALAYGVFGGIGRQDIDWGHHGGDFRQTDTTLGGFVGWNGAHGWVAGQLSYTNLDFDTHRDIVLGTATRTHDGSPGGSNVTAGVQAGWTFGDGAFRNGPVLGLLSQTIRVDDFAALGDVGVRREVEPVLGGLPAGEEDLDLDVAMEPVVLEGSELVDRSRLGVYPKRHRVLIVDCHQLVDATIEERHTGVGGQGRIGRYVAE